MRQINNKDDITKGWFKDWANDYDMTLGKIERHHKMLELAVDSSEVKQNDMILDIGCGTGLLSLKFLKKVECYITGIDSSPEMLEIFRAKIDRLGLEKKIICKPGDAASPDFKSNTFDIVASTVTMHHVTDKLSSARKIHDILKPGGRFVIGDIDMDTTGDHKDPERLRRIIGYLTEEFVLALKEGGIEAFKRMYDNGKKHILNEGEYCISFEQWKNVCFEAGFKNVLYKPVPEFEWFKVLTAFK
jgi:ubiquinone/menaquinone biosynthesis C-methylase UbiE